MEQGWDPEVTKYFRKIMATFFAGFMWLMINIMVGMYFGFAFINGRISIGNIIFYSLSAIGLAALLFYYYKLWKK